MVYGRLRGDRGAGMRGMKSEDLYMVLYPFGLLIRLFVCREEDLLSESVRLGPMECDRRRPLDERG